MSARPHRLHARRPLVGVALVAVLLAPIAACSDDEDETSTGGTSTEMTETTGSAGTTESTSRPSTSGDGSTASTDATDSTGAEDGIDPMDDAGTEAVRGEPQVDGVALIADVAVARHEGYDRVVWTFENGVPGYEVGYVEGPLTEDPSGEPITVEGAAHIQVRMEPASIVDLSGPEYREVYTGPATVDGDTPEITEVVRTGDFEAVSTWVLGVADPGVAFRVDALTDPPRLVVDVQNH